MKPRYSENARDVKRHIERGTIGRIGMAEMNRAAPYDEGREDGGAQRLLMLELDTLLYWFGDATEAYGYRRASGKSALMCLTLKMECGALACVCAFAGNSEEAPYNTYELSGSGGNICFDSRNAAPYTLAGAGAESSLPLMSNDSYDMPDFGGDARAARMLELAQACQAYQKSESAEDLSLCT